LFEAPSEGFDQRLSLQIVDFENHENTDSPQAIGLLRSRRERPRGPAAERS